MNSDDFENQMLHDAWMDIRGTLATCVVVMAVILTVVWM